jgi:hypothetical protein
MKAEVIIDLIITKHEEKDDSPIQLFQGLNLEPMIDYSGKMARGAFRGFPRWKMHQDRTHAGILDFKIMDNTGKMEHFALIERILPILKIEDIRKVFEGVDPEELGKSDEETVLLSEVQCSFLEQEVNWGPHSFQLRTFYGLQTVEDLLFKNAVPRDFFMCFIEKSFFEFNSGKNLEETMNSIVGNYRESEAAGKLVMYPPKTGSGKKVKVARDYRNFVYSNNIGGADWWIDPFLERIFALCERDGTSRYWLSAYHKGD